MDFVGAIVDSDDAFYLSNYIRDRPFQTGLLLSFLLAHNGHECKILTDCTEEYKKYTDDGEFWE